MPRAESEGDGWGWGEDALAQQMSDVKLPSTASTSTTVNKTAANTDEGWSAWGDTKEEEEEEDWDFKPVQRETKIDAKKNKDLNQKLFAAKRK